MNALMIPCLKATELMEKKSLFRLMFRERVQLWLHKKMCAACAMYEKQMLVLQTVLSAFYRVNTSEEHTNTELKKRILFQLNNN